MKKIYISGKITGDENWVEKFTNAEKPIKELCGENVVIFNPTLTKDYEGKIDYDDFLHIDFAIIDVCDALYMLKDWKDSKGAIKEYHYALSKGKKILYEE